MKRINNQLYDLYYLYLQRKSPTCTRVYTNIENPRKCKVFFYEYPISAIDNHKKNFYVGSYDMTDLVLVTLKDDDELRLDLCKMTL